MAFQVGRDFLLAIAGAIGFGLIIGHLSQPAHPFRPAPQRSSQAGAATCRADMSLDDCRAAFFFSEGAR